MSEEKKASDAAGVELVSGSISLPSAEENTLDEPVSTTILRDLRLVGGKLRVVLMPSNTSEETLKALRDWDLWGPLLLCLTLSIMLSVTAPAAQSAMVFTGVFVVIWVGAAIVTINAQLLGSSMYVYRIIFLFCYFGAKGDVDIVTEQIFLPECVRVGILRVSAEYRDVGVHAGQSGGLAYLAPNDHCQCGFPLVDTSVGRIHVQIGATEA